MNSMQDGNILGRVRDNPGSTSRSRAKTVVVAQNGQFLNCSYARMSALQKVGMCEDADDDDGPLDINVQENTRFVIALDTGIKWRFSVGDYGASLKESTTPIFNLMHYDGKGGWYPGHALAGCNAVRFDVIRESYDNPYEFGFNLHVDVIQEACDEAGNSLIQKIIIDPDIRHPGGSDD